MESINRCWKQTGKIAESIRNTSNRTCICNTDQSTCSKTRTTSERRHKQIQQDLSSWATSTSTSITSSTSSASSVHLCTAEGWAPCHVPKRRSYWHLGKLYITFRSNVVVEAKEFYNSNFILNLSAPGITLTLHNQNFPLDLFERFFFFFRFFFSLIARQDVPSSHPSQHGIVGWLGCARAASPLLRQEKLWKHRQVNDVLHIFGWVHRMTISCKNKKNVQTKNSLIINLLHYSLDCWSKHRSMHYQASENVTSSW